MKINFGEFSEKDEFLINLLQKGLATKIVKGNEKSQIHILKNNELGKEEYQLKIQENLISINVSSYSGLLYAFVSLNQILYNAQEEKMGIPLIEINDTPRFNFMLDISEIYSRKKFFKSLI